VDELNELGYNIRLTDPQQGLIYGAKALTLAKKIRYTDGLAEAHRIIGVGYYYLGKNDKALSNYLIALSYIDKTKNIIGKAKIYNNIGNLYKDIDYDKGLEYYNKSLVLADKVELKDLMAGLLLNIGNIHYRKKTFHLALKNYEASYQTFKTLNNAIGITQSLQNLGALYFKLHEILKAEKLLLEANEKAKENELNNVVASINLTLTAVYIEKNEFSKAEKVLKEGRTYAQIVRSEKLLHDYLYLSYELENKRKNYKQALYYLKKVYSEDSTSNARYESTRNGLFQEQYRQREKERENELIIERQKNNKILFWGSTIVSFLLLIVILLLIKSNSRKVKTNQQLTVLNGEISQQKEELDWVNHRLEEIIDERTKDLQIKNKKLSDYSWHLSHQIRGPIATMQGLMLLEKDKLIEDDEFILEMDKCLEEIDSKIRNINESLHNPKQENL
jgi:tetratricopeptide (TPR) repeat protein